MPKKVSYQEGSGGFFKAPVGSHPAIIVWIAELGTAMSNYGKDDREQDLLRVFYEIEATVNTAKEWEAEKLEEKLIIVEQNYTAIITEKSKLGKAIAGIYGKQAKEIKDFSLDHLLGKKCVINVVHNDAGYTSVDSVSMESKKMNYHEQEKESFYFWLNEDEFSHEIFDSFAPFVRERIEQSREYNALYGVKADWDFSSATNTEKTQSEDSVQATAQDAQEIFQKKEPTPVQTPVQAPVEPTTTTPAPTPAKEEGNPFWE